MNIKEINLEEYEISEQSDEEIIVLKKKQFKYPKWGDLENVKGYFIDNNSIISEFNMHDTKPFNKNVFLTEKHAKSALAMAQISQLMPYYGEITDEEWEDTDIFKYIIYRKKNKITFGSYLDIYGFLAFRTEEQRDGFLKNNEQLVKDYLMIE